MQIADLLSGTMRRISRARSIVSGVELWHPAKPLLENRIVFVHCIIMTACSYHHATLHLSIVMSSCICLHKTILKSLVLFSKTPRLYSNAKPGSPDYLVLSAIGLQKPCLKYIKYFNYF